MKCRHCNAEVTREFVDLGHTPAANAYLTGASEPETYYPLRAVVCNACLLVQLDYSIPPKDIFTSYDYFSSTSPTWLEDARLKAEMLTRRFDLGFGKRVIEVGSNDGYLLRWFDGPDVIGIDPAANCAAEAEKVGVRTIVRFFGRNLAEELAIQGKKADLVTGTNVLAHVPDINDFVAGLAAVLAPNGVVSFEFPHILNLIEENQFDTIYHEHYFYYSFHALSKLFLRHGLSMFDVEELPTHGGSLRIYAQSMTKGHHPVSGRVFNMLKKEAEAHLDVPAGYAGFQEKALRIKRNLINFVSNAIAEGKQVAAYGAPAKGSTLLNYCGLDKDSIRFVVDDSPHKQGKFMPGSHIPIVPRERLLEEQPAYTLILPWNLREPIREANRGYLGEWVVAIPEVTIL